MNNKDFSKQDDDFKIACKGANIEPTKRQASKFRMRKGYAFKLTEKQNAVLVYIKLSLKSNDHQPSVKEMGEYFDVSGTAITSRLLLLEKKGYIKLTGKARAIEILDK